jgi:hypothetical protein
VTNYLIKLVNCKRVNWRRTGAIAEAARLDRKDVDKAMKTLEAEGRIVSPKRCFWTSV